MNHETFYDVFSYADMYLDGGDKTINFDGIDILLDIPSLGLIKGDVFETCWWNIEAQTFHFIIWEKEVGRGECYQPSKQSVEVKQSDLAPFLVWKKQTTLKLVK